MFEALRNSGSSRLNHFLKVFAKFHVGNRRSDNARIADASLFGRSLIISRRLSAFDHVYNQYLMEPIIDSSGTLS